MQHKISHDRSMTCLILHIERKPRLRRASKNWVKLLLFHSTEIFSKRRKIYTIWSETRVICWFTAERTHQFRGNSPLSAGGFIHSYTITATWCDNKQEKTQKHYKKPKHRTFTVDEKHLLRISAKVLTGRTAWWDWVVTSGLSCTDFTSLFAIVGNFGYFKQTLRPHMKQGVIICLYFKITIEFKAYRSKGWRPWIHFTVLFTLGLT